MKIYIITEQHGDEPEHLCTIRGPHGSYQSLYVHKHDAEWAFFEARRLFQYKGKKLNLHELDTEKN